MAQGTSYHSNSIYFHSTKTLETQLRIGTADNDINAIRSGGYLPQGYHIVRRLTDSDQFFIKTDVPDGLKMFQRSPLKKGVEETLRLVIRYKVRERYSFGFTDWNDLWNRRCCITISASEKMESSPPNFNLDTKADTPRQGE